MVRKLAFLHSHLAAILDLVKMATRLEHSLGSIYDMFLCTKNQLCAKFGTSPRICTIAVIVPANMRDYVLFRGKSGVVCGKQLTFLYTSPYEHVQYNV